MYKESGFLNNNKKLEKFCYFYLKNSNKSEAIKIKYVTKCFFQP